MTAWHGVELRETDKGWISKDYPNTIFKSMNDGLIYIEKDLKSNIEYFIYDPISPYTYWFVNIKYLTGVTESLVMNGGFSKLEL